MVHVLKRPFTPVTGRSMVESITLNISFFFNDIYNIFSYKIICSNYFVLKFI